MNKYIMRNFATGERVIKEQKHRPKMRGFVCVHSEPILPEINARGEHLVYDANNRPHYVRVNEDGFYYQSW